MDSTLLKGLRVLETLANAEMPRGVSDLSRTLGLTKSNVHRTLQTLVAAGFVRSCENGTYECTLKLFELASPILARVDVRRSADPFMQRLAEATRETIHLSVLDRGEVIYLHKIESPQPVRAYSTIGGRAPAYCVASGKALLAYNGDSVLQYLPDPLVAYTRKTISDRDALKRELEKIREQGFALNRGEWREEVCGVAAIVRNALGEPIASIGISGPADRLKPSELNRFSDLVMDTARALSRSLGYNPIVAAPGRVHRPLDSGGVA